jgi:hypothetical protein
MVRHTKMHCVKDENPASPILALIRADTLLQPSGTMTVCLKGVIVVSHDCNLASFGP